MTIHFYLNDEGHTPITSFHDMVSNPFKKGDIIDLDVRPLYPVNIANLGPHVIEGVKDRNAQARELFQMRRVEIVNEIKCIKFNTLGQPDLTIEYFCVFVD